MLLVHLRGDTSLSSQMFMGSTCRPSLVCMYLETSSERFDILVTELSAVESGLRFLITVL